MKLAQKPETTTQNAARVIGGSASKRRLRTGRETISATAGLAACVLRHTRLRECAQDEVSFLMPSINLPHPERAPRARVEGRTIDLQPIFHALSCGRSL